jgi:hypothetical protein
VSISCHYGNVTVNAGTFTQIEVAQKNSGIAGDGVSGFDGNRTEGDSHISCDFAPYVDRTERASDIADAFSF